MAAALGQPPGAPPDGAVTPTVEPEPITEGDSEPPRATAAVEAEPREWWRYMPSVHASVEAGFTGIFGEAGQPTGALDASETGFNFRFLELGTQGRWLGHLGMLAIVTVTEEGVAVEKAWAEVSQLPWNLEIRAGLLPSRAGFANARGPTGYRFVDQPLALGKMFGRYGQLAAGADLAFELPVPWELRLYAAMTSAHGPGMRSWYGTTAVDVEGMRDFGYQLGVENRFVAGGLVWDLEFSALLGPNDSGRSNFADVFALGFGIELPADGPAGVSMDFETEWFLRRRQYPGEHHFDWGGWAHVLLTVDGNWELGARYDTTFGVDNDPLAPTDQELRHRVTAQVGWKPYAFGGIRLAGTVDMGGPLSERSYGVHLLLRAGWRVEP